MSNEELPQPGVEVVQVFKAASPTVITPTLLSCVVGICKQLVEVYTTDESGSNSLNSDAQVQLPAFFEAPVGPYTGLAGASLVFSVNYGANISVVFSDPLLTGLSAATVVSQVTTALATAGVTSVIAELVGDAWRLRTVGIGEFQRIYIDPLTSPAVQTSFSIGLGKTYIGLTGYNQYESFVPQNNFPDPNGNLEELVIESSSIRTFLHTGDSVSLYEASKDSAFLRNGVVDDEAAIAGTQDIRQATNAAWYAPGASLDGTDFNIQFVGGSVVNIPFSEGAGHLVDETSFAARIMQVVPNIVATVDIATGFLTLTSVIVGYPGTFTVSAGTSDALAIMDPGSSLVGTHLGYSIEAVDDGNGDAVTPILDFRNENFTAAATAATVLGSLLIGVFPTVGQTLIFSDGSQEQTVVFTAAATTTALMAAEINAVMGPIAGGKLTAADVAGAMQFTHSEVGTDSVFHLLGGTYPMSSLDPGGTPTLVIGTYRGTASLPEPGDELWIDGAYYGDITQVAPGGAADRLKIDTQLTIDSNTGTDFYIVAKNLPGASDRPNPELVVDLNGNLVLKPEMLRDVGGDPVLTPSVPLYITYTAVRLDVTSRAANPGLLKFNNITEIETALPPVSTANPLALGLFFASINAPGSQVTGLGVDSISADSPYGTVEAFTRAAEYLEAFEVYAIAPLTHDATVGQVFSTHVANMSASVNKAERIAIWNPEQPTHALDTLVASGVDGNSSGPTGMLLDTKVTNLTTLVTNAGIVTTGAIPTSEGLFLDIASDDKKYSIASIAGSTISIRTVFAAGENDDNFYANDALNVPPLPAYLVQEQFAIKVRGAALVTVAGDLDKDAVADNIQAIGRTFQNRRFWMTVPDSGAALVNGIDTLVEGFYFNAGIVGMISQQPPQQSFTNFPMTGYKAVYGSNDTYTRGQLNRMAAGGAYIIVQDAEGAPLTSRQALTTDMTSIETRTDSITKVVDMSAKFQRNGLRNFIGRFNITQGFLDSLGTVLDGLTTFLVDLGVLVGANVNNIIQDEDAPDTVLIDETLDVPYPCNYIRLTLEI